MIIGHLIHPDLLMSLASAGHGARIVIADALYPHSTSVAATADRVNLNLRAGMVPAMDVLEAIASTVPLEAATYMQTAEGEASPPVQEFRQLLSKYLHNGNETISWSSLERMDFYDACCQPNVCLLVATGEVRPYANLLLTLGVP